MCAHLSAVQMLPMTFEKFVAGGMDLLSVGVAEIIGRGFECGSSFEVRLQTHREELLERRQALERNSCPLRRACPGYKREPHFADGTGHASP